MVTLPEAEWRSRRAAHHDRVDRWLEPHLARRSAGVGHPVEDFLFTYYSFSPAALRRWHPGIGVRLTGDVQAFRDVPGYVVTADGAAVGADLPRQRVDQVRWIHRLLTATADRPAKLSCFGLHEWAMVYGQRPDEVRHATYPLRLGSHGTDTVVDQHRISCTHHDAFRFFTPSAKPRNTVRPSRETQHEHEQPGCLHVSMDLYRWSFKLSPMIASELVADCFALAREVRRVDMRASPYDLSDLGVEPIRIETPEGKAEYAAAQRAFADQAAPLRGLLIAECERLLEESLT